MAGAFSEKTIRTFWPPGAIQKNKKITHLSHAHSNIFVWLMFRFGAGHTVVAGVGIADGSRAKYDAGI